MVSHWSTKTTGEIEIEKFITHRSWKKYTTCLWSHTRISRQGTGRMLAKGTEAYAFIEVFG